MNLVEIDLSLGDEKNHPAWNEDDYFLVERKTPKLEWYKVEDDEGFEESESRVVEGEYDYELVFGRFAEVWFGWNFGGGVWGASGFQYDQPGHNHSCWGRVWKLVDYAEA